MITRFSRCLVVAAMVCGAAGPAVGQGYTLVVNAQNPATELSKDAVSKMFMRQVRTWSHGGAVVAVDLDKSAPARASFSTAVLGQSVANIESYWLQQVFAGKDEPPAKLKDDAAVLAFVGANAGAVGYVSPAAALGASVKKVTVK